MHGHARPGFRVAPRSAIAGCLLLFVALTGCASPPSPPTPHSSTVEATRRPTPTPVTWRVPPPHAVFDYQIGGAYPPAAAVGIVDRDRADAPVPGRYNICYTNAFQTQPEENPWWRAHHPDLLVRDGKGRYVEDADWPGEWLLDTSTPAHRTALAAIVGGWFADCAARGYQAVEPDNLDSWTRSGGRLSQVDAVAYATLLVAAAHDHGLAIGQKNAAELSPTGRADIGFDFAIAEDCSVYDECRAYLSTYGGEVFEIEYTDNDVDAFRAACADHGARISIVLRDRDVVAAGQPGYHNQTC